MAARGNEVRPNPGDPLENGRQEPEIKKAVPPKAAAVPPEGPEVREKPAAALRLRKTKLLRACSDRLRELAAAVCF